MKSRAFADAWFILLMGLIYTFNYVDRTIIAVAGEAMRRDLGLSDMHLGILGGLAFALFYAVMGIPIARLAERRSRIGIIAAVTSLWSVMTAACGMAANFVQLLLFRMGVGIGEAGFTPALVSAITDRFPVSRRASMFSIILVGAPLGSAVAAIGGGWIAIHYGWRWAFVAAGAPGVLLALLLFLTVREPERIAAGETANTPPLKDVLTALWRSRTFVHLTAGSIWIAVIGQGLNLFLIPFAARRFDMDLREAGVVFAISFSLAIGLSTLIGGFLADRIGKRDVRWYIWAPAIGFLLALPFYVGAILQDDWRILVGLLFIASIGFYAFLPSVVTLTQRLVVPRMRASTTALHAFGQSVLGTGIGSVLIGMFSDRMAAAAYAGDYETACRQGLGVATSACREASGTGLQASLLAVAVSLLLASVHYFIAARTLREDIRE